MTNHLRMINLESSIIGYHNPRKHFGLTPEEFMMLYLKRQAKMSWNKVSTERALLCVQILKDWDIWIERIKVLFPNTLK